MTNQILTQARLKEVFSYSPETGLFMYLTSAIRTGVGDVAGCDDNGYVAFRVDGRKYRAHRLAYLYMEGEFPPDGTDHINRCKSDNRWSNLRHASQSANSKNSTMRSDNTSGVTGVYFNKAAGLFHARITVDKKVISLGYYKNIDNAKRDRKLAMVKYGFSEAHGRRNNE